MPDNSAPKTKQVQSSSSTTPYGPAQPGINQGIKDLGAIYKQGGFNIPYYPGQTLAGTAPETAQGWQQTTDRAMAGSPNLHNAEAYDNALLTGNYTALQPMINSAQDSANSHSSLAGRYGSNSWGRGLGEGIGNVIAQNAGAAAARAPGFAQADYLDPQMLGQVGQQRQQTAQDQINEAIKRYTYQQQQPINAITAYMDSLNGFGNTTTGTQPIQQQPGTNPWLGALGLAAQAGGSYLGGLGG